MSEGERRREDDDDGKRRALVALTTICALLVIESSEGFEPRGAPGSQGACFATAGVLNPPTA